MMLRDENGKRSASVNAKLGKSIAFGCILGVLVSLLKHQRDEGHIKRARAEHERAIGLTSTGMNGNSNNRRMWDVDFRSSGGGEIDVRHREEDLQVLRR